MSSPRKKLREGYVQIPMDFIRRLLRPFERRRWARVRAGYGVEVLFAGWVDLPKPLQERKAHKIPGK